MRGKYLKFKILQQQQQQQQQQSGFPEIHGSSLKSCAAAAKKPPPCKRKWMIKEKSICSHQTTLHPCSTKAAHPTYVYILLFRDFRRVFTARSSFVGNVD
jgi:hypothetical protein